MAELILKIGSVDPDDPRTYQDGDVVHAVNNKHIRIAHAENICHPWKEECDNNGLRSNSSLSFLHSMRIRQFKMQRLSSTMVRKTDIAAGTSEDISFPCDDFLESAKKFKTDLGAPKLPLYGELGSEIWFEGNYNFSTEALDSVWQMITDETGLLEDDHSLWPATEQELKSFLFVPVKDFDDEAAADYRASLKDEGEVVIARRKHNIAIEAVVALSAVSIEDVRDNSIAVDLRSIEPQDASKLVVVKDAQALAANAVEG